jgi:hypothetical protein
VLGQEREDRTLLSQQQMTAIINEVSGERAMHHVLELVPYAMRSIAGMRPCDFATTDR